MHSLLVAVLSWLVTKSSDESPRFGDFAESLGAQRRTAWPNRGGVGRGFRYLALFGQPCQGAPLRVDRLRV